MFKSDTVSFERQTILLDQPRHRAGTIGRRQTALPYVVVIDQDAKLFERLQSTFVFSLCAKMRVDLWAHQRLIQEHEDGHQQLAAACVRLSGAK